MRSWNVSQAELIKRADPVRNLPMRSWKLNKVFVCEFLRFCSQFTNEELKLSNFEAVSSSSFGSQFTNEELKRF